MCRTLGYIPTDSESTELRGCFYQNSLEDSITGGPRNTFEKHCSWCSVQWRESHMDQKSKHGTYLGWRRPRDQSFSTIRGVTLGKSKSTLVLAFLTHEMCVGLTLDFPHWDHCKRVHEVRQQGFLSHMWNFKKSNRNNLFIQYPKVLLTRPHF